MSKPTLVVARTILLTAQDWVLLVAPTKHGGKFWEFPGGKAKCSDQNPHATAKRELFEETAIQAEVLQEIVIRDTKGPRGQLIRYGFFGKKNVIRIKPAVDCTEIHAAKWFRLSDLPTVTECSQIMLNDEVVLTWLDTN